MKSALNTQENDRCSYVAYSLLCCDNIMAVWYGLYKHFTSNRAFSERVNCISIKSVKSLLSAHSLRPCLSLLIDM